MHKEFALWQFIAERLEMPQPIMLLVVAESSGSSPGRQGYKMAVGADGSLCGSIGGGIMEMNLVEQSRDILSEPTALAGGLTRPIRDQIHRANVPNSSGMICSGRQTVIFKLLSPDNLEAALKAVHALEHDRHGVLELTSESFAITPLEGAAQNDDFAFEKRSDTEFAYRETLGGKNELYVVGGGHCALALCDLMSRLDFHISLFDDRPGLNTICKNRFAHKIGIIESYESITDHIPSGESNYVVVMTLGYKTDEIVIKNLLDKNFKYFGVLGSKAKMAKLLKDLREQGCPSQRLELIHTPIGLPINSRTPEEIAVSIAAEIIAVKNSD